MTISDLKLKIFREIDSLDKEDLEKIHGMVLNFIQGKSDVSEWEKLTEIQRKGILDADKEVEEGKGVPHHVVMESFKGKYSND